MKNKLLLVFFIFINVSIFADKKIENEIVEDSKLYDAIKEINQTLKRSNKYLYILSEKDNYYPEKTYTGCPVETACLGFTINKKQYVISPWIFDKDFFILHLYLRKY